MRFVENKIPDLGRVGELLGRCVQQNQWANEGPLFEQLAHEFARHTNLASGRQFLPCANGGVALEAMARLHEMRAGRRVRWLASAFSFSNLGRGYFSDVAFLDCDRQGLLDSDALATAPLDSFDGIVLTNPHGLYRDFKVFTDFALEHNKALIIDNAAGMRTQLPDWAWQSFSLHHTKPYGMGEGGLALVPDDAIEDLRLLISYNEAPSPANVWLGNGKISDISCAFLLDRLQRAPEWKPAYHRQEIRLRGIAERLGFSTLSAPSEDLPLNSLPLLAPHPISRDNMKSAIHLPVGKYYKPLAELPAVSSLFARLVNVACHLDTAELSDQEIETDLLGIAGKS
jgi:dTDP-4-amino-4,6-dideoxygalactose transaminase